MTFYPFEVTTPHMIYALLGGFIVLFGMFSLLLRERLYIGEAIWAFLFGVIIGPYCAGVFDPRAWGGGSEDVTNAITLEFARVVLAIGVFAIGVELPKAYMAKHWKSLFYLLVPVMTWGWFVSAGLIYALIPSLSFLSSLAIAACLTPTDPILAAAVVGGKWADKHVPAHLRHLLAAESGCNDGAAFPFLFIALYLIVDKDTGTAIKDWVLILWLYQVLLGSVIGILLGFSFRHLMKFCQRRDLIDRHSYVAQYISLAILSIGVTTLLGSDDLLAAFFCGTAFAWDGFFNKQTEEAVFSSVIDTLFNIAAFIFVGAWMPFNQFQDKLLTLEVWRLIVIAILVLLLRRLPIMIALYKWIPDIKTFREAVFSGHFGPIGIGAVFISTLAVDVLHKAQESSTHESDPENPTQLEILIGTIQPVVAFMVLCSITIHGLSIPSFSLGRRVHSVSRTWSRRDTMNSNRDPEWAQHTRNVGTRREDIVINRDHPPQGILNTDGDPEKGEISRESIASSSGDTKIAPPSPHPLAPHINDQFVDSPIDIEQGPGHVGGRTPLSASTPSSLSLRSQPQNPPGRDYRQQSPPDGSETLAEWQEGHHRVIERRLGPGSDVEVTVINEDPASADAFKPHRKWNGKLSEWEKEAEDIGAGIREALRKEAGYLGKRARQAVSPARSDSHESQQPLDESKGEGTSRALNSALEEDDDDGWASEGSDASGDVGESGKTGAATGKRSMKSAAHPHHVHAHKSRRRFSFRRAHSSGLPTAGADGEIVEEQRGRELKPVPSRSAAPGITFVGNPPTRPGHHAHSGHTKRPGTADSYLSRTSTRPGTGDSLRNNRIESIRALHSVPPTRESSPSRSVRFVDADRKGLASLLDVSSPESQQGILVGGTGSPHGSAHASRAPSPAPTSPGFPK
ncbi:Sodium/hydrogen exchanger family-domain-containing protein [Crepidotus variabilis]|uniref:Sodium/hydrogen exchanger family-domain-containing protein n=1 Tax=Crepidotus variabilis TaxID=179855 RepID=A0A9P6E6P8_9AGAR|nr:Sodium/hydrogen exchanger family-domain-containing protein [Crepidotus variabilis]